MSAGVLQRSCGVLVALLCGGACVWLSAQHPLAPGLTLLLCAVCWLAALRWPDAWLVLVPAALPLLSLAPWTGWRMFEEFDLLVLAILSAGYLRLALWPVAQTADPSTARRWRALNWLLLALWGCWLFGLVQGWRGAQAGQTWPPEASANFANTLRVGKTLAWGLLAVPLLRAALLRSAAAAQRLLGIGVVTGLVVLTAAVLWERAAFPSLFNFAADYRTTGLFWEMHVGGAAIDAFLALTVPFAVWALARARRPWAWAAAAVLLQVLAYVCLTTFARGVYGAVLGGLVVAGWLVRRQRSALAAPPAWRKQANALLRVVLVLEVTAMALASSFLIDRLIDMDNDFGSRWNHWARGLETIQTPAEWWGGVGLGRLPARYAALGPEGEFPGAAIVVSSVPPEVPHRFLRLYGPASRAQLAGRYALTQQVQAIPGARYRVAFDLRSAQTARLRIQVCERHLLYPAVCQTRNLVRTTLLPGRWERFEFDLRGPLIGAGSALAPRLVSLSLATTWPGGVVDISNLSLSAGGRGDLLRNGHFESGLAHWFPVVKSYFLPWHIDNLYLELLIERGVLGLMLFVALMAMALWHLVFGAARWLTAAPYLAASLASGCALGLVSSIMDMPRVAFLFVLLALWSLHLPATSPRPSEVGPPTAVL